MCEILDFYEMNELKWVKIWEGLGNVERSWGATEGLTKEATCEVSKQCVWAQQSVCLKGWGTIIASTVFVLCLVNNNS